MKIKSSEMGKLKPKKILKGLPDELKTEEAYDKIETEMALIMLSDHKHIHIETFMKCKRCQDKVKKRHEYILSKGFESYQQYLEWKKIMQIIKRKEDFKL